MLLFLGFRVLVLVESDSADLCISRGVIMVQDPPRAGQGGRASADVLCNRGAWPALPSVLIEGGRAARWPAGTRRDVAQRPRALKKKTTEAGRDGTGARFNTTVLSCPVLSCPALSCPVLSCLSVSVCVCVCVWEIGRAHV